MNAIAKSLFTVLFVLFLALPALSQGEDGRDMRNCYSVRGEARYGALAYKHVVIVTNRCEVSLQCEVWTDVDPTPRQSVTVGPKSEVEVMTRNNSPARGFKAYGECKKAQ